MMGMTAAPVTTSPRNAALDNLRVVAMLLGLVSHGALPYTATGLIGCPLHDRTRHAAADACYLAVHDFRMQLFFLLAGFAAAALAARRGVGALVHNRAARVALPLALGVLLICPAMHLLFARHAAARGAVWDPADSGGWVGPNFHLWFLYYLLLCCAPLVAVLAVRRRVPRRVVRAADAAARWFLGRWWKIPALAALAVPVLWGMPTWWVDTPKGFAPDPRVLVYYLGFFLAGAVLYRHPDLLAGVGRRWAPTLAAANLLVLPAMLRLTVTGSWAELELAGDTPAWFVAWKAGALFLGGLYTWLMIAGLIGLFQRHFAGTGGGRWQYLAGASYWCYLAGFPVQAALQAAVAARGFPILAEFLLVNAGTFAVLLASYELCVRHTWVGLMLNGRRPAKEPAAPPARDRWDLILLRTPAPEPGRRGTPRPHRPGRSPLGAAR